MAFATMEKIKPVQWILLIICWITCIDGISELIAIQKFSHEKLKSRGMIRSILKREGAFFHHIPGYTSYGEFFLGARNKLYLAPVPDVSSAREVLEWKPTGCGNKLKNKLTCPPDMKPVSDHFACGNHIRLVLAYSDRKSSQRPNKNTEKVQHSLLIVCGSNGGNPKCQIYRRDSPHWIPAKKNITGSGVVNGRLCPGERNPFYFDENEKKLFVPTRTQNKPTFVSFYASDSIDADLHILNHPTFFGSADSVNFHSIFRYGDKVYVLFNEEAFEDDFNSKSILTKSKHGYATHKKHFARVARVCLGDRGSLDRGRRANQFSTFFKARLLCQSPGGFKFDYLVAVNEIDSTSPDPIIRGVFAADDGLTRAHGICYFRTSDIERGINTGAFVKFSRGKGTKYLERKSFSHNDSLKLMQCRNGKASSPMSSFARRHPLKTDPVINDDSRPWKAFTTNSYNITSIVSDSSTSHEVLFLGTDNGLLLKLSSYPIEDPAPDTRLEFNVVESLQLFPKHIRINSLMLRKGYVIAISDHDVRTIHLHRCKIHRSCRDCIGSLDPHCSWDTVTQKCSSSADKHPSVKAGLAYCNSVETKSSQNRPQVASLNRTGSKVAASGVTPSTVGIIATFCLVLGCIIGCLVECVIFKRYGTELPTHLLHEVRRRTQKNLGNENTNARPKGVSNLLRSNPKADHNTYYGNDYDSFIDHHTPPSSAPTDKKLNNDIIKNNLMASLNHHKSIDNFL